MRLYPNYSTSLFTDIWDNVEDFIDDYDESPIPNTISEENVTTLFWLLYAKYGNSPIANMDTFQWKQKVFSLIFMYGPNWVKELDIQNTLRGLTDEQIKAGSFMIYNHAYNPETAPSTGSATELTYINEQNTNRYSKGAVDAYTNLMLILKKDVTNTFLQKFQPLFKQFVYPEHAIVYESEIYDADTLEL